MQFKRILKPPLPLPHFILYIFSAFPLNNSPFALGNNFHTRIQNQASRILQWQAELDLEELEGGGGSRRKDVVKCVLG